MASAGAGIGGRGRGKSLDAEINLVPFIDLLSMCICFLLMTAVWVEVGSIDVKQAVGASAPADALVASMELDVQFASPTQIDVRVRHPDRSTSAMSAQGATPEAMLAQLRGRLAALAPSKAELGKAVSAARLTTKAGVAYGELIGALDALRESGIVNVGVMPVKD